MGCWTVGTPTAAPPQRFTRFELADQAFRRGWPSRGRGTGSSGERSKPGVCRDHLHGVSGPILKGVPPMLRTFVSACLALVIVAGGLLAGEIKGKVTKVEGDKITVTTADGEKTVTTNKDTQVINAAGKPAK